MRVLTPEDQEHMDKAATTWAVCWRLVDRSGNVLLQTSHDQNILVDAIGLDGLYKSSLAVTSSSVKSTGDLAVDNLEIKALLNELGITESAIQDGLYDDVQYTFFLVNWAAPINSGIIFRQGRIGNIITFLSGLANMELRGIKQAYQQGIIQTYQSTCRANFGDARCRVSLGPLTVEGAVAETITPRSSFRATGLVSVDGFFEYGLLTFTSGANQGFAREIKLHDATGLVNFLEPFPKDIQVDDEFEAYPGCPKTFVGGCKEKWNNVVNFRGEPHVPSNDEIIKIGGQ